VKEPYNLQKEFMEFLEGWANCLVAPPACGPGPVPCDSYETSYMKYIIPCAFNV